MRRKAFSWTLPPEIEARLGESSWGRQRVIFEVGHLLVILHSPPDPDSHERAPQVFLRTPDGTWHHNGVPSGAGKLRQLLAAYRDAYKLYDDRYEGAHGAEALFDVLDDLPPVARAAANMAATLQKARETVPEEKLLLSARDESYEISRSFELLLHDVRYALDYRIARSAEAQAAKSREMAASQHKLNILAAITFPLMAVATIFGMNLQHGFEGAGPGLFWVVLSLGGGIGFMTRAWVVEGRGA